MEYPLNSLELVQYRNITILLCLMISYLRSTTKNTGVRNLKEMFTDITRGYYFFSFLFSIHDAATVYLVVSRIGPPITETAQLERSVTPYKKK